MAMRAFSPQFVGRYLCCYRPSKSSDRQGAYQLDGVGLQLFDRIGDV